MRLHFFSTSTAAQNLVRGCHRSLSLTPLMVFIIVLQPSEKKTSAFIFKPITYLSFLHSSPGWAPFASHWKRVCCGRCNGFMLVSWLSIPWLDSQRLLVIFGRGGMETSYRNVVKAPSHKEANNFPCEVLNLFLKGEERGRKKLLDFISIDFFNRLSYRWSRFNKVFWVLLEE